MHAYDLYEIFTCNGPNLFCGKLHSDQKKKNEKWKCNKFLWKVINNIGDIIWRNIEWIKRSINVHENKNVHFCLVEIIIATGYKFFLAFYTLYGQTTLWCCDYCCCKTSVNEVKAYIFCIFIFRWRCARNLRWWGPPSIYFLKKKNIMSG